MSDVVGRETIAIRRDLTEKEIEDFKEQVHESFDDEARAKQHVKDLEAFAKPRALATFDPSNPKYEDEDETTFQEARALDAFMALEKKRRSARVALIKAERLFAIDAASNGYVYDVRHCRLELDASGTQTSYVAEPSGEVVHTRAATADERQLSLPGDELPAATAEAPSMVQ